MTKKSGLKLAELRKIGRLSFKLLFIFVCKNSSANIPPGSPGIPIHHGNNGNLFIQAKTTIKNKDGFAVFKGASRRYSRLR
jgi:hypothetical protein